MKKVLTIFSIIIAVTLTAMIIIPYFFKYDILEAAKSEANKSLNARVDFGDIELSLFSDFPNLSIEINDILVSGADEFINDTLAKIGSLGASINLSSLFGGGAIQTNDIYIKDTYFNAIINKNGNTNWDIIKDTQYEDEENADNDTQPSTPEILFKNIRFKNINISFKDLVEETSFSTKSLNININGNFSEENSNINLNLYTPRTNVEFGGIKYLNNTEIHFDAQVLANLKDKIFIIKDNKLNINQLELSLDGSIDMNKENILLDLKLKTNNNNFKTLLSMVPEEYKKDIKNIKTKGELELSAYAKGTMTDTIMPSFGASIRVSNAQIQYPELPEKINNINLLATISNPGGSFDNTLVEVSKFHFDIANNPFSFNLNIKTPISDPYFKGNLIGEIDFNNLKKAIPLENINISGLVDADISFDGKMSYIEKEQYEKFKTKGLLTVKDFIFVGKSIPNEVKIQKSILTLSSRQISLKSLNGTLGESDFSLKGSLKNYIPYLVKGNTLIADFTLSSTKLNINKLMTQEEKKEKNDGEHQISVIEIPNNLNLKLNCNISKMLYDKLTISNTKGIVRIKDSKAKLNQLNMQLLEGKVCMNGEYNAQNVKAPTTNFNLDISNINLNDAYNSFSIIKEMMPMAMNCSGDLSMNIDIQSTLNKEMKIIPKTLNGKGRISSQKITINQNQLLDGLAQLTKDDNYKKIDISNIDLNIEIQNGNITLKPFTADLAGTPATIYGTQSVDGEINYTISSSVDKKLLGSDINKTFNHVPGYKSLEKIDIDLKIEGTLSKPTVKPNFQRAQKQIAKAAEKELKEKAKEILKKNLKRLF